MSKLKAKGNDSGTGVFTLETPPTNTDRTLTLPDTTGTLVDTTGATFTGGVTGTDVTLSGGLYVGGTGSANYLDDYETGTWTPSMNGSSGGYYLATYVKTGSQVTVIALFNTISWNSGYNYVSGIPFANGFGSASIYSPTNTAAIQQCFADGDKIKFRASAAGSGTYLLVGATYKI